MIDVQSIVSSLTGNLKVWAGNYSGLSKQVEDLRTANSSLQVRVTDLETILIQTKNEDKKTISDLQAQLYLCGPKTDPQEDYWNNRYPKTNKTYERVEEERSYQVDVRSFLTPNDSTIPIVTGATNDDKALAALKYVRANVTYTSDDITYKHGEYWAFFFETLKNKKGDCEDGAILIANIMLASGVPYWRVRLNAGSVNGGGHCYVTYCRETDNQFVVLDWCYWPNNLPMSQRKLHKDEQNYDNESLNYYVWFSWNLKYVFGEMQTMAEMPDDFLRY